MSDQPEETFDRLQDFDLGASAMPLSASEVRRRGDRMRRRRAALSVVAAAVAVAAIATPIAVLGNDGDQAVGPAGPDRTTQTPPTTPDSSSSLLGVEDLVQRPDRTAWAVSDDDFPVLGCAPIDAGGLASLGGTVDEVRFGADVDLGDEEGVTITPGPPIARASSAVVDFATTQEADAAFETVFDWLIRCDDLGADRLVAGEGSTEQGTVPIEDGEALWLTYGVLDTDICDWKDGCDGSLTERQGIAHVGSRLVVFTLADAGGPIDPTGLQSDMAKTFPEALTRAGATISGEVSIDSANQGGEFDPGAFLDDVPLDQGLVAMEGDGGEKIGPGPEVDSIAFTDGSCLGDAWPAATALDKRAVSVSGPEYFEAREIAVFESSEAATTALEAVRSALAACPTVAGDVPDNDVTYELVADQEGDNSVVFSSLFRTGLGGSVYGFAQFGSVVLGQVSSGELSPSSVEPVATGLVQDRAELRESICALHDCGTR